MEDNFAHVERHEDGRARADSTARRSRLVSTASKKYVVATLKLEPRPSGGHHSYVLPPKKLLHFVHRLLVFGLTLAYVGLAFGASYSAMHLLRGFDIPLNAPLDDYLPLMSTFLGDKSIREGPLVVSFLRNSTAPVAGTIFLNDSTTASFTACHSHKATRARTFSDVFMRSLYTAITEGASYNITSLASSQTELIAPIVDCQATAAEYDLSSAKFFFLVRQRANPDNVSVLVTYLSNQQYRILSQAENGAAAVASLQLIDDMRATDVDKRVHYVVSLGYPFVKLAFRAYEPLSKTPEGLRLLRSVSKPGEREAVHTLETACREGYFLRAETEQSNLFHYDWVIESDALLAVSRWRWVGKPVLHDSWAWVHGVQFFIGMGLLSNLVILCIATARNFREGTPWIGDAFVSLSTAQFINGAAVLVSWYINEFWALREWCISTAFVVSGLEGYQYIDDTPMRVDLMTLYLALCGMIGHLFRERIDPLVAVVAFHIGYDGRVVILQNLSPSIFEFIEGFAAAFYMQNASPRQPGQDKISPMGFWTTHALGKGNVTNLVYCLLPLGLALVLPIAYITVRKVHRFFYPDIVHVLQMSQATVTSENEQALGEQMRVLTMFEIATGAKLESRFGVVTDFEPCLFIKGTKVVSADGIYSTGFIIANKKYLLQTSDYWSIVLMKVLRRRFRNIYVYDVRGSTVEQTARLVYPHTLTVQDLVYISVGVLS